MKRIRKNLFVLSIVVILPMLLVGCKPKVNADESAKIWFNYLVKEDATSISKIGVTQETAKKVEQTRKVTYKKAIKGGFTTGGLKIEEKQLEQMYLAYIGALKKVSVTTEVVSKTSKIAQVKVKETYIINQQADSEKTKEDANKYIESLDPTNAQKFNSEVAKYIFDNEIKKIKNSKISVATKEKTFKFVIKDKMWVPEDISEYTKYTYKVALGN